jgi:DNA-directed RNA polymerase specialized sigma24 family protein
LKHLFQLTKRRFMTEQEVFDKLKQGDKAAMEWVFRHKRDAFMGYFIKHYSLSVDDATDLASDALIALAAAAERNQDRPLTAEINTLWITIGRNIYLGQKKKEAKLPIVNWGDFLDFTKNTEGSENPFESDDFETLLPFVAPLLTELKEPCQTILKEYYWKNKTDKEVSEALNANEAVKNMSSDAVKMKRTRCIDALRKLIFNQLK